ncbi:hypothetical protein [Actinoplanes sp. G11-F43]|uniref:hypothetical protein n=1 Tax=Actinoplanes sp. G11-F43 TaxID=3424130 RepID=UPI003D3311FF
MAARVLPEHLPFLVLRCDDWVWQVRSRAQDALTTILRERPGEVLWAVLPMASYLSGRRRGGAALRIVEKLVEDEFDRVAPILLRVGDQRGRRLAYTIGDRLGRWTYSDLLGFALTDPDPLVRSRAAESVRVEAVRRGDVAALRKLAGVRWAAVRSLALVGLADLGHEDELSAYLDDPSPLIRAYARSRTADAAGRYRAAIAVAPTPELLIGLAEMGDRRDVPLLTPLVTHVDGRVRAAAARSLALLDSVPLDEAIPLLTDPVPAVVRCGVTTVGSRSNCPGVS